MGYGSIAKPKKKKVKKPTAASRALAQATVTKSAAAGQKMVKAKPPPKPTWKQIGKRVAKKLFPGVAKATEKKEKIRKEAVGGK